MKVASFGHHPKRDTPEKMMVGIQRCFPFRVQIFRSKELFNFGGKIHSPSSDEGCFSWRYLQGTNISFFPRHSWRWWLFLFPTGRWDMYPSFPGGSGHHFRLGETSPPPWSPGQVLNRRSGKFWHWHPCGDWSDWSTVWYIKNILRPQKQSEFEVENILVSIVVVGWYDRFDKSSFNVNLFPFKNHLALQNMQWSSPFWYVLFFFAVSFWTVVIKSIASFKLGTPPAKSTAMWGRGECHQTYTLEVNHYTMITPPKKRLVGLPGTASVTGLLAVFGEWWI